MIDRILGPLAASPEQHGGSPNRLRVEMRDKTRAVRGHQLPLRDERK